MESALETKTATEPLIDLNGFSVNLSVCMETKIVKTKMLFT